MFPPVTHLGGRRLSRAIWCSPEFVSPMCSKRHLEIRYDETTVPEWMREDDEWNTPRDHNITTIEQMHRYTIEDLLEASIGYPPRKASYADLSEEADRPSSRTRSRVLRKSLTDYECELNKHNFSRVLREIEVRGAYHHAGKLGKWKSPIYSRLRLDLPMKSAHTVKQTCGGGGGI